MAEPFDRIDAVLPRGIRYSDDYDTAKLQLAVFYYWAKASRAARASVRMVETGIPAHDQAELRRSKSAQESVTPPVGHRL